MIVTEPFSMWRGAPAHAQVNVYGQSNLDGLKSLVDAVSKHDCHLLTQVQDPGRGDMRPIRKLAAFGASALPDDLSWTVPHAMTPAEIKNMIEDFVESAGKLQSAGFSGVELSAGHGHLFHQFLSPWMNRREDDYGGSFENRARLVNELIQALRRECGPEFIIGLRLPGNDGLPGSINWADAEELAAWFSRGNQIDYLAFVQGSHAWTLFMHVPDMHSDRGTYIREIGKLRHACNGTPVAAIGRILEPAQAETILSDGKADFVMLGRTLIADAAWGLKSLGARDNDIRKCVSSNNCWRETVLGRPLACDNNPRVGQRDEVDWWPQAAAEQKRVVVVGGGVAGLEAAWIAAARKHEVTLFSSSSDHGGKLKHYAALPGCESVSSIFDVQIIFGQRAGVNYQLGWRAKAEDILACDPDTVILATGGTMIWPKQLPIVLQEEGFIHDLWETIQIVLKHPHKDSGTAVIYDFDGTDVTYSAAQLFRERFDRVVLINPCETIARDESTVKRQSIFERMFKHDIEIVNWSEPSPNSKFEDGVFVYRNLMTGEETEITDVALFTYATPRTPNLSLLQPLREAGLIVHQIGDAYMPRSVIAATSEGHKIGNSI